MLREIALLEKACMKQNNWLTIVIIVRSILPLIVRILEGNYYLGHYWYEYVLTAWYIYFIYIVVGYNFKFLSVGLIDFRRKLFYMKVLQSLISVDKDKQFTFSSYFPTINVC